MTPQLLSQNPTPHHVQQFTGVADEEAGLRMAADPAACTDGVHDDPGHGCVTQLEFDDAKTVRRGKGK